MTQNRRLIGRRRGQSLRAIGDDDGSTTTTRPHDHNTSQRQPIYELSSSSHDSKCQITLQVVEGCLYTSG